MGRCKEELVLTPELEANLRARRFLTIKEFALLYHRTPRQVQYALENGWLIPREREKGKIKPMWFIDMVATRQMGGLI
ncbi:hypothetical protein ACIWO4_04320 [Avibacterium paragallinarum]|uniref:hypothetical protein n=1 Tax=Avibacterium TaxID=292486 RepID=UPI002026F81E|nr:hypothetical protein [Avibacterium sp. 21-595]URL05937.1 hypothetical protein L4F92_07600 [Avibacterium sp. 21-595]